MPKKTLEYIDINGIRALFRKHWGLNLKRTSIYFYITKHQFPPSTGRGHPRLWKTKKIARWFAKNK